MHRLAPTALILLALLTSLSAAEIIYESGTLGPTGLAQGTVAATNVTDFAYPGVRFELTEPVRTSAVGGHFVSATGGTFFGALIELDGPDDFPDSGDLSTPDVLGVATLEFPTLSDEVFGELDLRIDAGWYALVFGAGLFEANGDGAALRSGEDIGVPDYIAYSSSSSRWLDLRALFADAGISITHRYVLEGSVVPEPMAIVQLVPLLFIALSDPSTAFRR